MCTCTQQQRAYRINNRRQKVSVAYMMRWVIYFVFFFFFASILVWFFINTEYLLSRPLLTANTRAEITMKYYAENSDRDRTAKGGKGRGKIFLNRFFLVQCLYWLFYRRYAWRRCIFSYTNTHTEVYVHCSQSNNGKSGNFLFFGVKSQKIFWMILLWYLSKIKEKSHYRTC